ncbi:hypothetical protein CDD83_1153 [Cordyceps sp. RAO-2017]|nr:hypothetical protein CDD83_1153 [Cordyceps sp. RAO-2017]
MRCSAALYLGGPATAHPPVSLPPARRPPHRPTLLLQLPSASSSSTSSLSSSFFSFSCSLSLPLPLAFSPTSSPFSLPPEAAAVGDSCSSSHHQQLLRPAARRPPPGRPQRRPTNIATSPVLLCFLQRLAAPTSPVPRARDACCRAQRATSATNSILASAGRLVLPWPRRRRRRLFRPALTRAINPPPARLLSHLRLPAAGRLVTSSLSLTPLTSLAHPGRR